MAMTRDGVVYDLRFSDYEYTFFPLTFRFSSESHMNKFAERVRNRVEWLNDSMSRRFHVEVRMDLLAALQCYMQVETRGFLVRDIEQGRWYDCAEMLRLDGLSISGSDCNPLRESTTTLSEKLLG